MELYKDSSYETGNQSSVDINLKRTCKEISSGDDEMGSPSKKPTVELEAKPILKGTVPGVMFQVGLIMLFIKRALDKDFEFFIGSEVAEADDFDDIVYKYNDENGKIAYRFVQAKHKNKPIIVNDLLTTSKTKNDFALSKYFISYCKIINSPLFRGRILNDFIICTNSDFNFSAKKEFKISGERTRLGLKVENWRGYFESYPLPEEDEILYIRNEVKINKFKETKLQSIKTDLIKLFCIARNKKINTIRKKISELMPDHESLKKLTNELHTFKNLDIDETMTEFLKKVTFITNYPNEPELAEIIERELGKKFHLLNARFVYDSFKVAVINWFKNYNAENKCAKFFTREDGMRLFCGIQNLIDSIMVSGVSRHQTLKLDNYKIKFVENLESIREFLDEKSKKILQICSNEIRMTAIKVWQTLKSETVKGHHSYLNNKDGFIFVNIEHLSVVLDLIECSVSNEITAKLLIIECNEKAENKLFADFLNKLNVLFEKLNKLILITNYNSNLSIKFNNECSVVLDDKLNFNNLDIDSQNYILNKRISLQGHDVALNVFAYNDIVNDFVDSKILSRLIENKKFSVGKTVPGVPNYYVERDFFMENLTRKNLFNLRSVDNLQNLDVLFLITAITKEELLNFGVIPSDICEWKHGEQVPFDELKFIILLVGSPSDKEIFKDVIKFNKNNEGKSICWLVHDKGIFYQKTDELLLVYLEEEVLEKISSFKYIDRILRTHLIKKMKNNLIIIGAEPGEGKTLFLNTIAKKIKNISHTSWVIHVNLNDFAKLDESPNLKDITFSMNDTDEAISFLSKMVTEKGQKTLLEEKLLKAILKSTQNLSNCGNIPQTKVVILFDGFDEICPTYKRSTLKLIGALKMSSAALICVTTRKNEVNDLQKEVKSVVYNFRPLALKEKITLCCEYLKYLLFDRNKTRYKRRCVIHQKIIDLWQEIKTCFEELMHDANPLIIRQWVNFSIPGQDIPFKVAYIQNVCKDVSKLLDKYSSQGLKNSSLTCFEEDLKRFPYFEDYLCLFLIEWDKSTHNDKDNSFATTPFNLIMLAEVLFEKNFKIPNKLHLGDLYDKFVQRKLDVYFDEKSKIVKGNVAQTENKEINARYLLEIYQEQAIREFYELEDLSKFQEFKESKLENNKDLVNRLCRVGLMKIDQNKLKFIHHSFAEYFVSKYIFKNGKPESVKKLLSEKILIEVRFVMIRKFLNCFLKPFCLKCFKMKKENKYPKHCCEGTKNYKKTLFKISKPLSLINFEGESSYQILDQSVKEGLTVLVDFILCRFKGNKFDLINPSSCTVRVHNPLQLAVCTGQTELFKMFFKTFMENCPVEVLSDEDFLKKIYYSVNRDGLSLLHHAVTSLKPDMIVVVLNTLKQIKDLLPFQKEFFYEFLKRFVLAEDKRKETILHHCMRFSNPECTQKLLESIREINIEYLHCLILKKNHMNQTAIHLGCRYTCTTLEIILKEIKEHLINYDSTILRRLIFEIDSSNETPIKLAFQTSFSINFINPLDLLLNSISDDDKPWYVTFKDSLLDPYDKNSQNGNLHLLIVTGFTKFIKENNMSYLSEQIIQENYENGCTSLFFFMIENRIKEIECKISRPDYVSVAGKPESQKILGTFIKFIVENLFSQEYKYCPVINWVKKHIESNISCQYLSSDDSSHVTNIRFYE